MKSWKLPESLDCATFRRWIDAFLDDEVGAEPRRRLQAHLDACDACARRLELEREFVAALRGRLERVPAPPGLETRIRASLEREAGAPSGSRTGWLRAPWFAAVAASLLLAVLIVPDLRTSGLGSLRPERPGDGEPGQHARYVEDDVMVVDPDCDRWGRSIAAQRKCRLHRHLNALKLADGTYWNISLDRPDYRDLLTDPAMRGLRLHVAGDYYPRLRTLQVHSARELARDTL